MSEELRKGWCPGALRPMPAKDGLLVRLRITGGILAGRTAAMLADLAERDGNGLLDLSARGNLQIRGVSEAALPSLQNQLQALGLLDSNSDAEAVRNVMASPLAGLQEDLDIRPLTIALEERLTSDFALHALPTKFGFLIDDAGTPSLAGVGADVRFDWLPEDGCFSIGLAGTRSSATRIGTCKPDRLADDAARIASGVLSLFARVPEARRMRDVIAVAGVDRAAEVCGGRLDEALPMHSDVRAPDVVGWRRAAVRSSPVQWSRGNTEGGGGGAGASSSGKQEAHDAPSPMFRMVPLPGFADEEIAHQDDGYLGLAAPFGRLDAAMLRRAASLASTTSNAELRLTPWRVILLLGVSGNTDVTGFITNPFDPRLYIAACVGADGCERGTTRTHHDATTLAKCLPIGIANDILLHVSGCAKGCAKASSTAVTLVARDGLYDLVRDGRPEDQPGRCGLDLAASRKVLDDRLVTMPEPA